MSTGTDETWKVDAEDLLGACLPLLGKLAALEKLAGPDGDARAAQTAAVVEAYLVERGRLPDLDRLTEELGGVAS